MTEEQPKGHPRVGGWALFWASTVTIPVALAAVSFHSAVPQFVELFKGFGAEVPELTNMVITFATSVSISLRLLLGAQLASLGALFITRSPAARSAFWIIAVLSLTAAAIAVGALYAPIFKMGKLV